MLDGQTIVSVVGVSTLKAQRVGILKNVGLSSFSSSFGQREGASGLSRNRANSQTGTLVAYTGPSGGQIKREWC